MKRFFIIFAILPFVLNAKEATVSFTGDILMHMAIKEYAKCSNNIENGQSVNNAGFDLLFENISTILSATDVTVGNMEFPIRAPYVQNGFIFNCPPEIMGALKHAGFDILSNANNHIFDQGVKGVFSTLSEVRKNGLIPIGISETEETARSGYVKEINGIKIAFYATTGLLNYPELQKSKDKSYYLNWFYDKDKVIEDIKKLKAAADVVILIFHTGTEYSTQPTTADMKLCHAYADAGADILIGHHPHVLQPFEQYTRPSGAPSLIFYSLGNFISDQNRYITTPGLSTKVNLRDSAVIRLTFKGKNEYRAEAVPVFTKNTWTSTKGKNHKKIQVFPLERLISEAEKSNNKEEIRFYKGRLEAVKALLGKFGSADLIQISPE